MFKLLVMKLIFLCVHLLLSELLSVEKLVSILFSY